MNDLNELKQLRDELGTENEYEKASVDNIDAVKKVLSEHYSLDDKILEGNLSLWWVFRFIVYELARKEKDNKKQPSRIKETKTFIDFVVNRLKELYLKEIENVDDNYTAARRSVSNIIDEIYGLLWDEHKPNQDTDSKPKESFKRLFDTALRIAKSPEAKDIIVYEDNGKTHPLNEGDLLALLAPILMYKEIKEMASEEEVTKMVKEDLKKIIEQRNKNNGKKE